MSIYGLGCPLSKLPARLVSALCVLVGWEPMIALKDTRGPEQKEADEVLAFAVRAVVEKGLAEARARRTRR